MAKLGTAQRIIDAEFTIVRGPYRVGEEHRKHRGWYFIGEYDPDGWPLFARRGHSAAVRGMDPGAALALKIIGALLLAVILLALTEIYVLEPRQERHKLAALCDRGLITACREIVDRATASAQR